ncbi:uncharacterized protein V6R79_001989 [Siganus canaliculatus]
MEPRPAALPWIHWIRWTLLLVQLSSPEVAASCRILRCNSDFVAATLDLGAAPGPAGPGPGPGPAGGAARYCSALRSYAVCTRRMARACRGDLAYHSAVQGIEDLLIQYRCPRAGPTVQPRPLPQGSLSGDSCRYEREGPGPDDLHCSVFGDPHVRTFHNHFHTCAVQGAWPVIDNDFLYVQVTSSPVSTGSQATALTQVTVIFKSWRQCLDQQLYQAELDNVPAAFADGSVASGERRGHHSLTVRTQSPGRQAEIVAAHIGTLLVVRQSGRSLGLSVRSPRAVVDAFGPEQDLQLCVWGCPPSQRLSTPPPGPSPAAAAAARAHCAALLPAGGVYYQACVFDLVASGDLNASAAAVSALHDARVMMADTQHVLLLPAATAAAAATQHVHLLPLLLGMLGTLTSA